MHKPWLPGYDSQGVRCWVRCKSVPGAHLVGMQQPWLALCCQGTACSVSTRDQLFGCRAELEGRLARMQSKLLRGEEMGGLAAAAKKKQQLLAARQREWQAQKDKAGTAFHHLPRPPCH